MSILSKIFTKSESEAKVQLEPNAIVHEESEPQQESRPYSESLVDNLTKKNENLTIANKKLQEKLKLRVEQNKTLRERLETNKSQINALHVGNRKDLTLERLETFFKGTELSLPEEAYNNFISKCEKNAGDRFGAFIEEMEKTKNRAFFEQLFTTEMDMAQGFNFKTLRPIVTFQRGENDIALAKKKGISLDELKANHIRITIERFDEIIKEGFIDPKRVSAACEIGAAWGAATRYIINRFNPKIYHSYEIDTAWAQWLQENLKVDSKKCDGETLSFTADSSIDICVASSCLYFMPFIKQWSYLSEFARVLRPGGIAVFNVGLIETADLDTMKELLIDFFPRRSFGYIPQHCVDTAFPEHEFEKLVKGPIDPFGYQVYRKL